MTVVADRVDEPNEALTVTLTSLAGASVGDGAAIGTVIDGD